MTGTHLVENEIRRFLSTKEPEVTCISGHWGVGKTYAWNKYLADARDKERIALSRYSYVSLFGINSLDDLRYAIFENTVQSSEIGVEPSLVTLQTNTMAAAEALGRKFVWFMQQLPWVKNHVGGLGPVWFLSVKGTIVCIDDIERRGNGLSVRDVMGLASHLKERKGCKVLLILNDDALQDHKQDFETYYEKVVDSSLRFAPTPAECAQIAINADTPGLKCLAESCVALGISNIRLIKKVERSVRQLAPLLGSLDHQILLDAIKSLTLFGWSLYEPGKGPSLEYLRNKTVDKLYTSTKDIPETEAAWNALLDAYGYRMTSDFDLVLLDGLRNGFFDPEAVRRYGDEQDGQIKAAKLTGSFRNAWRLYHDSFDNDQDEVLTAIYNAAIENLEIMSPLDLDGAVTLLKELERPTQAAEIIERYVARHSANKEIFNLNDFPFSGKISDPDVIRTFNEKLATFQDDRSAEAILLVLSKGWHPDDLDFLATVHVDEYYRILKAAKGPELRKIVDGCLQFDRTGDASAAMREIPKRAKEALRRIGQESQVNALRVRKYGIREPNGTPAGAVGDVPQRAEDRRDAL